MQTTGATIRLVRGFSFLILTASIGMAIAAARTASANPLTVLQSNPRYFTDGSGKAIYLVGSHTWSNGMEDRGSINPPLAFDYTGYINFMVAHNFNWMRLWTSEMSHASVPDDPFEAIISGPFKWQRTGPGAANDGLPKFDLSQLDQGYFDRMRSRVIQAGQSGIYVSVQLFNGYMFQFDINGIDGNPFEATNNVNGIDCADTCPTDDSRIPSLAWQSEQAYLRKVVDTVNDLDNVMYEVSNEAGSPYSDVWQANVIDFVKTYEAGKPKQHPIGMTFQFQGGSDSTLHASQADWISPSETIPPEATGDKVVINDTDHAYSWPAMKSDGQAAQRAWAWKNFLLGNNVAFMDPYLVRWSGRNSPGGATADPDVGTTPDPYWDVLRNAMRDTSRYASRIDLAAMTPQSSLASTGYCLANPGSEYLVYQPDGGAFTLSVVSGSYTVEWFNPTTGMVAQINNATFSSGDRNFTPPFSGDAVLYLKIAQPDTVPPSVSVTSPVSGQTVQGSITVAANASDDVGIAGVQFTIDGVNLGAEQTTAPYATNWNTATVANGAHTLTAVARDAAGHASSSSVSVTVDNPTPTITFVQSRSVDCGTVTRCSLSFSRTTAQGNLLLVGVRVGDSNRAVTITDTRGNAYSVARRQIDSEGDEAFILYAFNQTAGSDKLTVSVNGTATTLRFAIHEFHGLSALDQTTGSLGTGSFVDSGAVTTSHPSELVFGFAMSGNGESWTAGQGYVLRETPAGKAGSEYQVLSSAQSLGATFGLSGSDDWAAIVATFR